MESTSKWVSFDTSIDQKWSKERTVVNWRQCHGSGVTNARGEQRLAKKLMLVQIERCQIRSAWQSVVFGADP